MIRKGREAEGFLALPHRCQEQFDVCPKDDDIVLEASDKLLWAPDFLLEANGVVLCDEMVVVKGDIECQTPHEGCLEENEKTLEESVGLLEEDEVVLDENVVFLEHHDIYRDDEIIVLSNHIERRRRKDGYQKDQIK
jgi:hypothetical protein